MTSNLMAGKRGLIMGLANDKSIAWGIAKATAESGAELAFTYQGDAILKRVGPLAKSVGSEFLMPCDVSDPANLDSVFAELAQRWDRLDFVIHAIAFSDKEELRGRYLDTSAENFSKTLDISCFSFTAVCQRAEPLMTNGGSLVTVGPSVAPFPQQ